MAERSSKKMIIVRGAREHNLKDLSLEIPRDKLVVFTGISGSGTASSHSQICAREGWLDVVFAI